MFYYSKKSRRKIIHVDKCSHLRKTPKEFIGTFKTADEAFRNGYRFCKHCNVLKKKYRSEKKQIMNFCKLNGLTVNLENECIAVKSADSQWKIIPHSQTLVQLYHKNTYIKKNDSKSLICGYHNQNTFRSDICAMLAYITDHDSFRTDNPLYSSAVPTNFAVLSGQCTGTEPKLEKDIQTKPKKKKKKKKQASEINRSKRNTKKKEKRLKKAQKRSAIRNVYLIMDSLQAQRAAG